VTRGFHRRYGGKRHCGRVHYVKFYEVLRIGHHQKGLVIDLSRGFAVEHRKGRRFFISDLVRLFLNRHDRRRTASRIIRRSNGIIDCTTEDKRTRYQLGLIEIKLA
jgi:hypothetical protein